MPGAVAHFSKAVFLPDMAFFSSRLTGSACLEAMESRLANWGAPVSPRFCFFHVLVPETACLPSGVCGVFSCLNLAKIQGPQAWL